MMSIIFAQEKELSINDLFHQLGFFGNTPESIRFVNNNEANQVLNFERTVYDRYPDTIFNPEKIRFVSLDYGSDEELHLNMKSLKKLNNIEYLEIRSKNLFRGSDSLPILKSFDFLDELENLRFLKFDGTFDIDYDALFKSIKHNSNIQYLELGFITEEIELPQILLELKGLRGFRINGFKKIILPSDLSEMKDLESIVLVIEGYENPIEILSKLATIPKLKDLQISFGSFSLEQVGFLKNFKDLEKLTLFNFSLDSLQCLFDAFSENNNLRSLNLQNLRIRSGSTNYDNLKNLESLVFHHQGEPICIEGDLSVMKKLQKLDLGYNGLKILNKSIFDLKVLKELRLSYNHIKVIPSELGKLKLLEKLYLNNNLLTEIPASIGNLNGLQELGLENNSINILPKTIGRLKQLTNLNLRQNIICALPDSITELKKLESLDLAENDLTHLPENIGSLSNLKTFPLYSNFLIELPSSFTELVNLEKLEIQQNKLKHLPSQLGNLKKLRSIYLGGRDSTKISSFKSLDSSYESDSLRIMRSNNDFQELPVSLSSLKNLKMLDFENQKSLQVEDIFKILFNLKSYRYTIKLRNCAISKLPEVGWQSFYAENLQLTNNNLESIPKGIVKSPFLKSLSFKLSSEDKLNYSFRTREQLLAFYEEKGFLKWEEIPKTQNMSQAFLENAYNRSYTNAKNTIYPLFKKAIKIDSSYAMSKIRKDDYAEALMRNKEYTKAIDFFTRSIVNDTTESIRVLNFLIPQFRNRAEAYLKTGDTIAAIKDYLFISDQGWDNDYGKAALLAKSASKDSLSAILFKKGITSYKNQIEFRKNNKLLDYGYDLSLVELYIIANEFTEARNYLLELQPLNDMDYSSMVLMKYFNLVLSIIQEEDSAKEINSFEDTFQKEQTDFQSWSFKLFEMWLDKADLTPKKKQTIKELTMIIQG
ncbi:leucine rich repeat (LRR) protein [Leeuwenhoekiella aestuarii]|uniref:Leucine rich repeat (LRR) protein n=2 Tax=Leeuwenhoekiella aestuarii TaxID=2249426 RepID=A0A4Q0NSW5_9FLAO|nr:leucine-rich repeat domain-containing protein [Leeuwenhoekiella aestuarii]RXG14179.1 leucine rich repeat (LRR) protein [Leeuwenhoekiella aestuarii]RXG18928.1 leucine rich repeat (LRR) protein [Leeuwenhoekiella aestuarii]